MQVDERTIDGIPYRFHLADDESPANRGIGLWVPFENEDASLVPATDGEVVAYMAASMN